MYVSCKEARETHYWLRLLIKTEIVPEQKLTSLLDESNSLLNQAIHYSKFANASPKKFKNQNINYTHENLS